MGMYIVYSTKKEYALALMENELKSQYLKLPSIFINFFAICMANALITGSPH